MIKNTKLKQYNLMIAENKITDLQKLSDCKELSVSHLIRIAINDYIRKNKKLIKSSN
jgi:hypothetical protein